MGKAVTDSARKVTRQPCLCCSPPRVLSRVESLPCQVCDNSLLSRQCNGYKRPTVLNKIQSTSNFRVCLDQFKRPAPKFFRLVFHKIMRRNAITAQREQHNWQQQVEKHAPLCATEFKEFKGYS